MKTVVDIFKRNAKENSDTPALYFNSPNYDQNLTWIQIWATAIQFAQVLKKQNLLPGDAIGILATASWRWEVAQLAGFMCRLVVVGLDPYDQVETYRQGIQLTHLRLILVGNEGLENKIKGIAISRFD
jgi:long-subunit acyl-CoA synthetase (AMP-forming)